MNISILVCTHGDASWVSRAHARAIPSAEAEQPHELIVEHLEEGTLAETRNLAAERASGDWLCFLDADDELAPGYLDAMAAYACGLLEHEILRLLVPSVSYLMAGAASVPAIPNQGRWPELNECVIGTLVPSALFRAVGGFREFEAYEDWDLFLRCTKAGAQLVYVPDAVYLAHVRAGGRNETSRLDVYNRIWAEYVTP